MQAWIRTQSTADEVGPTILGMRKATTPAKYRSMFFERVKAARVGAEKSPAEMASLLDVPKDTYHRYETRTLMPHHLVPLFCQLTGKDIAWLMGSFRRNVVRNDDAENARAVA